MNENRFLFEHVEENQREKDSRDSLKHCEFVDIQPEEIRKDRKRKRGKKDNEKNIYITKATKEKGKRKKERKRQKIFTTVPTNFYSRTSFLTGPVTGNNGNISS